MTPALPDPLHHVLRLGQQLADCWRTPLAAEVLLRLRHQPRGPEPRMPVRCRPLPPDPGTGPSWAWACRTAEALGYTVTECVLPPPKAEAAGFTVREHGAIMINPDRPGGADYGRDPALLRAELALTLVHELVHTVDPDEHVFSHPGRRDGRESRSDQAREAASARASEFVAVLATEAVAWRIAEQDAARTAAPHRAADAAGHGCGGSQLRYLAALLMAGGPPTGIHLERILARASASADLLLAASAEAAWNESAGATGSDSGHTLAIGAAQVPLRCGPAAHGGRPPNPAAAAAAHWSRQRSRALAAMAEAGEIVAPVRADDRRPT